MPAQEKLEAPGLVTSDSLAAESIANDGSFGKPAKVAASSQPSSSSTANTTDTSAAQVLEPAERGPKRNDDANEDVLRKPTGAQNQHVETIAGGMLDGTTGRDMPKGHKLKEGGFDSDGPNGSFSKEVGSKGDPSREAILGMQKAASGTGGAGGEKVISRDGQFDVLGDTSA